MAQDLMPEMKEDKENIKKTKNKRCTKRKNK